MTTPLTSMYVPEPREPEPLKTGHSASPTIAVTPGVDPRVALATNLHAAPGVYALVAGSGLSRAAGIPTGWDVLQDLIGKVALAEGLDLAAAGQAPDQWWESEGRGPARYDTLIASLGLTDLARRSLLRRYFDPGLEDGGPIAPSVAHHALAALCAGGLIRVVVTTNFDHLIERALEQVGVAPQVVATPDAADGMTPLAHANCTVIKLNGDYSMLGLRNSPEELSEYPEQWDRLLAQILDEYGLIVVGWSAEYDLALVRAIEKAPSRRYPTFWACFQHPLGMNARRLTAQRGAVEIPTAGANEFLADVHQRVVRLQAVARNIGRPRLVRITTIRPEVFSPSGWAARPLLHLRGAVIIGPTTTEDSGILRRPQRESIVQALHASFVSVRVENLAYEPVALADPEGTAATRPDPEAMEWQLTPSGHQSTAYATYRMGGDGSSGVSAVFTVRMPGYGQLNGSVVLMLDIGLSLDRRLTLEEVALLLRDALVLLTGPAADTLTGILPSESSVNQCEIHIQASNMDIRNAVRSNSLADRIELALLGDPTRPLEQSLSFGAYLTSALSDRQAAELVVEGLEVMALDSGFVAPDAGLAVVRQGLAIEPVDERAAYLDRDGMIWRLLGPQQSLPIGYRTAGDFPDLTNTALGYWTEYNDPVRGQVADVVVGIEPTSHGTWMILTVRVPMGDVVLDRVECLRNARRRALLSDDVTQ